MVLTILSEAVLMYGVPPTAYRTYDADTTDVEGNYNLTDHFSIEEIQVTQSQCTYRILMVRKMVCIRIP
jgi:hypothetical protein